MRSWLLVPLVAGGCYHPSDVAHCAITCDPLVGNCPGTMVCGIDSFCHTLDEPLNGCLAGTTDAAPRPDAQVFPKDGPPDVPVLLIDAAPCSSEWHADFSSDPTTGGGLVWSSAGAVPFSFSTQVMFGTWNAPDMTGLATSPAFAFQSETTLDASLDLPQVGDTARFAFGLTDGTQFAQLSLVLGHPTAPADTVVVTNDFGAAQPEMLVDTTAPIGKHHVRFDVAWTTGQGTLTIDAAAATPFAFSKGAGSAVARSVSLSVAMGANVDALDVCVP